MNTLYQPIPELDLTKSEQELVRDLIRLRRPQFVRAKYGVYGWIEDSTFIDFLNARFKPEAVEDNFGIPILCSPQLVVINDDVPLYPEHFDYRRDASLNFLIQGDTEGVETYWKNQGTHVAAPYEPGRAFLFNTQVPHGIEQIIPGTERITLSVCVRMSYNRFQNLHRANRLFPRSPS